MKKRNWFSRHWLKILIGLLVVAAVMGGLYFYNIYNKANNVVSAITNGGTVVELLTSESLSGEDTGYSNILIAGNSSDDADHGGAALTDSIMVASINISTNQVTLVSIPRDFWVYIDNYGSMKINAVYEIGGIELLQSTVEQILGITINHYALINYTALKEVTDAVGGIDIEITSSDSRGIFDPNMNLTLTNGIQHLDGETTLKLARSRNVPTYDGRIAYGLPNGDFDRAMYQRKIATALVAKIATVETLTNQTKLIALLSSLENNISSNFSAGQLRRLYDLSKTVVVTNSIGINGEEGDYLLSDYVSDDGQATLVPTVGSYDYSTIQAYVSGYLYPVEDSSSDL